MTMFFIVYRRLDTKDWLLQQTSEGDLMTFLSYEDASRSGDSVIADYKHHGIPSDFRVARLVDKT